VGGHLRKHTWGREAGGISRGHNQSIHGHKRLISTACFSYELAVKIPLVKTISIAVIKKQQISTHIGGDSEMEEMQKKFMFKNKLKVIWWGCFAIFLNKKQYIKCSYKSISRCSCVLASANV